jgi:DNA-3-methyladenine glycosylase I
MIKPSSYCQAIQMMKGEDQHLHKIYHDEQYGFPIEDDNELFCRLVFEINQAGLSWTTILKKQHTFRKAYHNFNIKKVAAYKEKDIERLLNNAGIIRNRLKVHAAIENAKTILNLQKEAGSFKNWLNQQHPKTKEEWTQLFKKTFLFTGGEIVNEFLLSTGYLAGAHEPACAVYKKIIKAKPLWNKK